MEKDALISHLWGNHPRNSYPRKKSCLDSHPGYKHPRSRYPMGKDPLTSRPWGSRLQNRRLGKNRLKNKYLKISAML